MIKFNLEKALNGAKVITRDGREVTQLHLFNADLDNYPLVCVIDEEIHSFLKCGCYVPSDDCSEFDLFMAPEMLSGFINVDADGFAERYETRDRADLMANDDRIACIDLSQFPVGYGLDK